MEIDWKAKKAIVIESDDWGGCTRTSAPDIETSRKADAIWAKVEDRFARWKRGTLETREHMQRLFDFLLSFKGGDGRPVVMTPMYLVGNPDFDAIERGGFAEYIDIGIDEGFPHRWEREGLIEKAREGMKLGIWFPEYHGRTHHYHGQRWVDTLRKGEDEVLMEFFKLRMFGISRKSVGLEYDDMSEAEQFEWVKVGFERFRRCFGYSPHFVINHDGTDVTERVWSRLGVIGRLNAGFKNTLMGAYNEQLGLTYLVRNAKLDPLGMPGSETEFGFSEARAAVETAWRNNQPAIVSTHRKNFASLDEEEDKNSWQQFEAFLGWVAREHPDAVYMTDYEVVQLYRRGVSAVRYGDGVVVRNYTGAKRSVTVDLPEGAQPHEVIRLPDGRTVKFSSGEEGVVLEVGDGDYLVRLKS